jgi:hypothetical protein
MALAVVVAAESTPTDTATALAQYGAIGILLGFFVWWSRKDKESADARWADVNQKMFNMQERQITALNESADANREQVAAVRDLSESLKRRPCLHQKDNQN